MPRFLDVHPMKGLDEDILKKLQDSPLAEFSVKHLIYSTIPRLRNASVYLKRQPKRVLRNIMRKLASNMSGVTEVKTTA
ncbi:MAG: hypothetical protein M3044_23450 [Thermoproteota archaeon]|nr:hypothetical protein [Thermoproteota archaeon]